MNSDDLCTALVSGDLSRPRLTWYDEASGERIDLSGKTLVNWVAKAANWLDTEMALSAGDELGLTIPPNHWRAIYWSLAGWTRGLTIVADTDADAVVTLAGADEPGDLAEPAIALAASPLQAMPDTMPPPGETVDYADLVLPQDVPAGSRVLLDRTPTDRVPAVTAALIGGQCSVVVVCSPDHEIGPEKAASEAVDLVL